MAEAEAAGAMRWIVGLPPGTLGSAVASRKPTFRAAIAAAPSLDLPRVDAVRPGAAHRRGAPPLGRDRRRRAGRHTDTALWTDDVWVVDSTPVECGRSRKTVMRSLTAYDH